MSFWYGYSVQQNSVHKLSRVIYKLLRLLKVKERKENRNKCEVLNLQTDTVPSVVSFQVYMILWKQGQ